MFIRINALLDYPIGSINIHNTTQNYQKYAGFVVVEVASSETYFSLYAASGATPANPVDGMINANSNDWIYPAFDSYTIGPTTYPSTMRATLGNRIFFAQSVLDWKIQTVSSYSSISPQFPIGIILPTISTLPAAPELGHIIVSGSGADKHVYCYLNGTWKQLDN
jgi:hypothetical protein